MTRLSDIEQQALQRFVRARAPDFSADEQADLDAWLADDAHRTEFGQLQNTWTALDGLAGQVGVLRHPPSRVPTWLRRSVGGVVAAGIAYALFLVVGMQAPTPQRFETAAAEHRLLTLADGTTVALNAESAIELVDGTEPQVDVLRGDVFIDVRNHDAAHLEVRVGGATIRDIGTRFAVASVDGGGSVAVEAGIVELRAGGEMRVVHAGRAARFAADGTVVEATVERDAVAPWREQHWHFDATPLSVLAAEMARQQRIQVDIADPSDAALTVSGTFGFAEPQRVLWAAAQVHGLELQRLGERHFSLQRTK
jgi:transmembrane sensor